MRWKREVVFSSLGESSSHDLVSNLRVAGLEYPHVADTVIEASLRTEVKDVVAEFVQICLRLIAKNCPFATGGPIPGSHRRKWTGRVVP